MYFKLLNSIWINVLTKANTLTFYLFPLKINQQFSNILLHNSLFYKNCEDNQLFFTQLKNIVAKCKMIKFLHLLMII